MARVRRGAHVKRAVFLCLALAGASFAQPVSVGVKAGVPLTDFVDAAKGNQAAYFTNTKRYTVGATLELHLPARFGIEIDALYKRFGFDGQSVLAGSTTLTGTRGNAWEFPLLAKFEFVPGPVRPFVDAGAAIRHITGIRQVRQVISAGTFSSVELNNPPEFNKATDVGVAFGAGIALKIGRVRISPELRFTRWGGENLRDPVNALLHTHRNQGDFLIGFTF
jgi:Outer membrane protein beta-barrel domain